MNANIINKSIEMTKTEAKAAGKFNTPEYNELMELMKNFRLGNRMIQIILHWSPMKHSQNAAAMAICLQ